MPSIRSALKQSPAVVVSVAALMFGAGTGVSLAASSTSSAHAAKAEHAAVTTLKWHRLTLTKGWKGKVRYAVSNGVVYLSGSASTRHPHGDWMLTLPRKIRPTSPQQDMPVVVGGKIGFIQLLNDGKILPASPVPPKEEDVEWVSLSGISYGLGS